MNLSLRLNVFLFPFFILINNFLYYKGYISLNFVFIFLELLLTVHILILSNFFFLIKPIIYLLITFLTTSLFVNNYWHFGALLNLLVLLFYSFSIINAIFIFNLEKLLGVNFFSSIFIIVLFFIFGEISKNGLSFYRSLYYNISENNGVFVFLDSTLTVPLLLILFLFSTSFLKNKSYKIIITLFTFTSLIFLERRGPLLFAIIFLILNVFNIKSRLIYKLLLFLPIIFTIGFTLILENINDLLLVIDTARSRGSEASNQERIGLYIHFFRDLKNFGLLDYLNGHIETFKNIRPDVVYLHPHNTLLTLLFLSGILPVLIFIYIHIKLINELVKHKLFIYLRMLMVFYFLYYTESILNNFSFFTVISISLIYFYLLKSKNLSKTNISILKQI